jgi:flagellar biosynthesis protein
MSDPSHKSGSGDLREGDSSEALRAFPGLSNIAVALRHDRAADTLPRIVASGRGAVAEQILAIAQAEGISVRKDADLAEVLVALEVGSDIPVEAFAAVAEILSYIYRANQYYTAPRAPAAAPSDSAADTSRNRKPDSRLGPASEDREP